MSYDIVFTKEAFATKLIHIATEVESQYKNSFPYNCGYYNTNGKFSWDCWNLVKSVIWGWQEDETVGYYCYQPGLYGLGDWAGSTILANCDDVTGDFSKITKGEFLLTADKGHAGVYVGEFTDRSGQPCNVVECTTGWNERRVVGSWVDEDGTRRNCKGGIISTSWDKHGKLPWIDYGSQPKPPTPTPTDRVKISDYWNKDYTVALQIMWDCRIVDGIISRQAKSDRSALPNVLATGESGGTFDFRGWPFYGGGSALVKEIQRWVGVSADGHWGKNTTKAWQKAMNDNGYGPIYPDGVFGPKSARLMGEWINDYFRRHPEK